MKWRSQPELLLTLVSRVLDIFVEDIGHGDSDGQLELNALALGWEEDGHEYKVT